MFILSVLALLAGACVDIQVPEGGDGGWNLLGGDKPVTFSTSIAAPETKTTSLSSIYTSFRVFAFYQAGNISEDPGEHYVGSWADLGTRHWTPDFMYNQQVNWVTDHWEYTPVKFWPNNPEITITFWAYAPANAVVTLYQSGSSTVYSNTSSGLPHIMLTVPSTADTDFMVSEFDMVKDHSLNPNYPTYFTQDLSKMDLGECVNFLFDHALSKVNFEVSKEDPGNNYDVELNIVTVKGILFTGVLMDGTWVAGTSVRNDFEVLKDEDSDIVLATSGLALSKSGILLPQRLDNTNENNTVLYVQYRYKNRAAVDYTTVSCSVPMKTILGSLDSSQQYTLKIKIAPGNPILFTAEVVKWDSNTNGYFNVD